MTKADELAKKYGNDFPAYTYEVFHIRRAYKAGFKQAVHECVAILNKHTPFTFPNKEYVVEALEKLINEEK